MGLKRNVGLTDRVVRAAIAVPLFYLALFFPDTAEDYVSASLLALAGGLMLFAALSGHCPIYAFADISTNASDCER